MFGKFLFVRAQLGLSVVRGCKTESAVLAKSIKDEPSGMPATFIENDDEERELARLDVEKKRNKSRLLPQHLRMLKGEKPYADSESWIHETVKYKRMMFGRFGLASGVDPRLCFPTAEERRDREEYERVAYPETVQQMRAKVLERRRLEQAAIQQREEQIEAKLAKLETWKKELRDKVEKREKEARAVREKKERLVEEVRRHFGFTVDPKDERFKEMLAQKEKEDKKKTKEAKKLAREEKIMSKLLDQEKNNQAASPPQKPTEGDTSVKRS